MGVERIQRVIPATGVIENPTPNNFCLLISTTAAINLRAEARGISEGFNSILGAFLIKRVRGWDNLRVVGAPGTTVEYLIGTESVEKDETDTRLQIATISGVASFAESPSAVITDTADTAQAAGTQTVIAANLLRRRITIGVPSNALNSVRVSAAGGAARGVEIQPGTNQRFPTTAALTVRNDDTFGTAAGTSWYAEEE